jgi:hypothetical protein
MSWVAPLRHDVSNPASPNSAGTVASAVKVGMSERPVNLEGSHGNSGWSILIQLREQALEIWYKRPTDADFISTGRDRNMRKNGTGEPLAESVVSLPGLRGRVPFLIRYRDLSGAMKGPFSAVFDADAQLLAESKKSLGRPDDTWALCITSGYRGARSYCDFTPLLNHHEVLREIRFSVDNDALNQTFPVPQRDLPTNGGDEVVTSVDIPRTASFVCVEIAYSDGTRDRRRVSVRHVGPAPR